MSQVELSWFMESLKEIESFMTCRKELTHTSESLINNLSREVTTHKTITNTYNNLQSSLDGQGMSAVVERCGNSKYKLLVDEVEFVSRIDGAIQNLFQELEDAKKDTYKIQKFLWL